MPTTVPAPTNEVAEKKTVVSTETISTQNMTGFLTRVRGSSLRNEAQIAGTISERSKSDKRPQLALVEPGMRRADAWAELSIMVMVPWEF